MVSSANYMFNNGVHILPIGKDRFPSCQLITPTRTLSDNFLVFCRVPWTWPFWLFQVQNLTCLSLTFLYLEDFLSSIRAHECHEANLHSSTKTDGDYWSVRCEGV